MTLMCKSSLLTKMLPANWWRRGEAIVFGGINVLSGQVTKWKAASRRMDSPRSFGHLRDYLHQRWCISPLFFFPDEVQHLVK
jgi:hypothetical protein